MRRILLSLLSVSLMCGYVCAEPDVEGGTTVVDAVETNTVELTEDDAYPQIELLTEALLHIRKHYVDEKTYREITYGAIHGMLESLDPHSSFMELEEYTGMKEDTAGKFSGIGIHIGLRDGHLTVIAPIEDTPAFRAGLQSGDRIIKIEDQKTAGKSLRDAVKLLRGEKGSTVTITVLSLSEEEPRTVEITRDDIVVPSVKGTRMIRDGIGYIRITQFARPTAEALQRELDTLTEQGLKGLVLDLRGNPGGLLRSAIEVSEKFLEKNDPIVTTRGRDGVHDEIRNLAGGKVRLTDFPMAVLINGGSASASEIVAGALQDHGRALIIGQQSFGKGSVQSVIPLSEDRKQAIRLTIAYYYTPADRLIHGIGVTPDIVVPIDPADWRSVQINRAHVEKPELYNDEEKAKYADVIDTQLQRATDILHAVILLK